MVEAIKEYIFQNWILMLILGAFFVVLFITSFSSRRTTIRYLLLLIAILLLSIVVFVEFYLPPVAENTTPRLVLMALRYSATPFVLALVIMVLVKRQNLLVFIPAAILLIIDIVSIFTGIVFGINPNTYKLERGALGYLPFIVCGLYMLWLIVLLVRRSNKRWIEITPIIFLSIALASGLFFPFIFEAKFSQIYCTIIATSLFIYYVFTILELAKKDALTGVLNREAYYIETRRDYKDITAIISLDMNGLKTINDTYGHAAGDEALVTLALCFAKAVGVRQSVYRMGGDEFIVVCRKTSKEDVENIVRKIQESVAQTKYSCSIGYSYHEPGTIKLEDLLKESDKQMYSDKEGFYKNKGNQPL